MYEYKITIDVDGLYDSFKYINYDRPTDWVFISKILSFDGFYRKKWIEYEYV